MLKKLKLLSLLTLVTLLTSHVPAIGMFDEMYDSMSSDLINFSYADSKGPIVQSSLDNNPIAVKTFNIIYDIAVEASKDTLDTAITNALLKKKTNISHTFLQSCAKHCVKKSLWLTPVAAICDTKKTVSGLVSASLKYGVNNIFSDKVKKSSVLGKTTNLGNKIATFAVTDTIITGTFPTQNIVQKVTIKKIAKVAAPGFPSRTFGLFNLYAGSNNQPIKLATDTVKKDLTKKVSQKYVKQ